MTLVTSYFEYQEFERRVPCFFHWSFLQVWRKKCFLSEQGSWSSQLRKNCFLSGTNNDTTCFGFNDPTFLSSFLDENKIQCQTETVGQNISLRRRTLTPFLYKTSFSLNCSICSLDFTFANTLFSNTSFHAGAQRIMAEIPLEVANTDKSKILSKWNYISIHFVIYVLFSVNISCTFLQPCSQLFTWAQTRVRSGRGRRGPQPWIGGAKHVHHNDDHHDHHHDHQKWRKWHTNDQTMGENSRSVGTQQGVKGDI